MSSSFNVAPASISNSARSHVGQIGQSFRAAAFCQRAESGRIHQHDAMPQARRRSLDHRSNNIP